MSKKSTKSAAVVNETVTENTTPETTVTTAAETEKAPRAEKLYGIQIGEQPPVDIKPWTKSAQHGRCLIKAIEKLVADGKTQVTRKEIMEVAIFLGCRDADKGGKATNQNDTAIFAWWRTPLKQLGWLSY